MALAEIGERIVSAGIEAAQAGLGVVREAFSGGEARAESRPVDAGAAQLVTDRAALASSNTGERPAAPATPTTEEHLSLRRDLRLAVAHAQFRQWPAAAQQPAAAANATVLVQTAEVTIKRETTAASDPSDPPIERIVFDAGAGDDRVRVTRDPKTGATVIDVNGERHTIQFAHDNATGGAVATIDGKQYNLARDDVNNLKISLGDGNDRLEVGAGVRINLSVEGGDGDDFIRTGAGDDRIEGGAGDDTVYSGAGRDYINGSTGHDRLHGGDGHDTVYGGDGDDHVQGDAGDDYLEGGRGRDRLLGDAGRDVLSGGLDDDTLEGGAGDDRLYAGAGADKLYGSTAGDNKKNTARDIAYAQQDTDSVAAGTQLVNVELKGTPGGLSIRVVGSPEFVERVEQDIEFLRSSPNGRRMLEAFDRAYERSRSPLAGLPLVGGLFNDGNTVTIQELTEEDNGFADWPRRTQGGPHPFLNANGTPGPSDDSVISYNTRLNQIYDPDPSKPADRWKYFDPVVVLYHEMSHAYNVTTGTFQNGTYQGGGPDSGFVPNNERQAVGLPNGGVPFDNDFDPATPPSRDNPRAQTENGLREEMNRPLRPSYGDS